MRFHARRTQGILPASLEKLTNPEMKRFVMRCLSPKLQRPTALELLQDDFLVSNKARMSTSQSQPQLAGATSSASIVAAAAAADMGPPSLPPLKLGSGAARELEQTVEAGKRQPRAAGARIMAGARGVRTRCPAGRGR